MQQQLKIAHIALPLRVPPENYGGTERIIYNLAAKQAAEGHDVTIFAGPDSTVPDCKVKIFTSGYSLKQRWIFQKLVSSYHMVRSYKSISNDFDIIHNHVWEEGIALSFLSRVPCLTTLHGVAHTRFLPKIVTKTSALTRRTKLVAISAAAFKQHRCFYGDDLLGYVHNAIDITNTRFYECPSRKYDIELSFIGKLDPHKGAHVAISIADRLYKAGKDIRLRIAGRLDSPNSKYAKQILSVINNKPYIEFMPNISTELIPDLLGNSDAMLFPILWDEPFGIVMLEALSYGTPVIGFERGSVPEIITNGVNGFVCRNAEEMYQAILAVPQIRRHDCRESIQKNFSVDNMYRNYINFYRITLDIAKPNMAA